MEVSYDGLQSEAVNVLDRMQEDVESVRAKAIVLSDYLSLCDELAQCVKETIKLVENVKLYCINQDKGPLLRSHALHTHFRRSSVFDDVDFLGGIFKGKSSEWVDKVYYHTMCRHQDRQRCRR